MITPVEVEDAIQRIEGDLEAATDSFAQAEQHSAECDAAYKKRYLTLYLASDAKTNVEKDRIAEFGAIDQWTAKRLADAQVKILTERMRSLRDRLDAFRTLAANVRHQSG